MRTTIYLHSDKESQITLGEELGLTRQALDTFKYALYEVALEVEVDPQTGEVVIVKCDGMVLSETGEK